MTRRGHFISKERLDILPESVLIRRRATEKEHQWNKVFKQRQHKTSRGRKHGFKLDQDFLAGQWKSISSKGLDLNESLGSGEGELLGQAHIYLVKFKMSTHYLKQIRAQQYQYRAGIGI